MTQDCFFLIPWTAFLGTPPLIRKSGQPLDVERSAPFQSRDHPFWKTQETALRKATANGKAAVWHILLMILQEQYCQGSALVSIIEGSPSLRESSSHFILCRPWSVLGPLRDLHIERARFSFQGQESSRCTMQSFMVIELVYYSC